MALFKLTIVFQIFICVIYFLFITRAKELNDETWDEILTDEWLVKFYAPWCPACQVLAPIWQKLEESDLSKRIKFGSIDVVENTGVSGRFLITTLPTIYHVKDGVFRLHVGSRTEHALRGFIMEKSWKEIDPVHWTVNPSSPQMTLVSYVFTFAGYTRSAQKYLENEGYHQWVFYTLFGISIVVLGLFLGLVMIVILDLLTWCCSSSRRRISSDSSTTELSSRNFGAGDNYQKFDNFDQAITHSDESVVEEKGAGDVGKLIQEETSSSSVIVDDSDVTNMSKDDTSSEKPDSDNMIESAAEERDTIIEEGSGLRLRKKDNTEEVADSIDDKGS